MAASSLCPSRTSARKVALELQVILAFSTTSPWLSTLRTCSAAAPGGGPLLRLCPVPQVLSPPPWVPSQRGSAVAVQLRARMVLAQGVAAQRAGGAAGSHQGLASFDQGGGLLPADGQPGDRAPRACARLALFLRAHFERHYDHLVGGRVVAELHGPHRPFGYYWLLELDVWLRWRRAGQVGQDLVQAAGQQQDLFLFQLEGDELVVLASLQVEGTLAGRADGSQRYPAGVGEVERRAHRRPLPASGTRSASWSRPASQLTAPTLGPSSVYKTLLSEPGATNSRWNMSKCIPRASASTALMGSA